MHVEIHLRSTQVPYVTEHEDFLVLHLPENLGSETKVFIDSVESLDKLRAVLDVARPQMQALEDASLAPLLADIATRVPAELVRFTEEVLCDAEQDMRRGEDVDTAYENALARVQARLDRQHDAAQHALGAR